MSRSHYIKEAREQLLHGIGAPDNSSFTTDDFQKAAIDSVVSGKDTLVVAPTGAGKTHIAIEAITAALYLKQKSVYTTPLKALSNTKYADLKLRFEPQFKVGLLTGDRKIDTDADVVVATTEIYRNELYHEGGRFSLIVLDEVHFLADSQRGPVWEESIILSPKESTLLMLSASISNAEEIASWITSVRGKECQIVTKIDRPVELRLGFLHPELGPVPLRASNGRLLQEVVQFYGQLGLDSNQRRLRVRGSDRPWKNAKRKRGRR
jgi:ATP-dependent RNA helicase HelY